jgi:hypothetical protein
MVEFVTIPDEKEAVAQWAAISGEVDEVYNEIWGGVGKIPNRDNGNSRQPN